MPARLSLRSSKPICLGWPDGNGGGDAESSDVGPTAVVLDRHARDLLQQGDRQLASREGGRPAPRARDATVRNRVGLLVSAGHDLRLAAFQGNRIRLPDRIPEDSTRRNGRNEPRASP